jgi:pilus assembly protein CpaC
VKASIPRLAFALSAALALTAAPALGKGRTTADADSGADANPDEINLAVAETRTLPAKNVKNYSEGAPGIVDIKLTTDNSQFVITARKPGATSVLFIHNDGSQHTFTVNVFARSPQVVERELRQLLEGLSNLRIRRIGARHVIDGSVADEAEKTRVDHVATLYSGQVESLVVIGSNGPPVSDSGLNKTLVRIDFYFVQFDTSSGYSVGLGWPKSIGAGGALTGSLDLITRDVTGAITVNQPLPQLDLAASHGWGKVLKHATVVTSSGAEAKFQSGGEQNYAVPGGIGGSTLQKLPYGVDMTIVPQFDPVRRDLQLKVNADVSDLTEAGPGTAIPGRQTSKVQTLVAVKLGQSLAISGIRTSTQQHSVSGLPLLSEIPVLGLLFGSHVNVTKDVQGVIYIVPSVLENVAPSSMELIDGAVKKFEDYNGNINKVRLYDERPPSARR